MPSFQPGSPRDELSLAGGPRPGPGGLLGVEHEYRVSAAGRPVDFRDLLPRLVVEGKRLDPGDRNAYRLASGLALTCDEGEAEVATPPIAVARGFTDVVVAWAQHGRSELERILPPAHELQGYSTHLSAAMPDLDGDEVSNLYARTFAPALALLLERAESQGLYVRPRPGRLELCGEFVEGARLGAVAAFVAGSARASALAVAGRGTVPQALAVLTLPAIERYGLRVTRYASGVDLYEEGRAARLPLATGGTVSAQEYLEGAWRTARGALGRLASNNDTVFLDRMVAGALPLGVETRDAERCTVLCGPVPSSPLGQVIRIWRRPGFVVQAVVATWDFTVFRVAAARASVFVSIPRQSLAGFVAGLNGGWLDRTLLTALETADARPLLSENEQTRSVGVFSGIAEPAGLLPVERAPGPREAKTGRGPGLSNLGPRAAPGRPGKSTVRPWKLILPLRPPTALPPPVPEEAAAPPPPLPLAPPLAPRPAGPGLPSPAPSDSTPALPPVSTELPAAGGIPWLVATAVAAVVLVAAVIAGTVAVNSGGMEPSPTAAPVTADTPLPTKAPSETALPLTSTPTPTTTPKADAANVSPSPTSPSTSTPLAALATATPTATLPSNPTEPPGPTPTPTRFATETPRPTFTPTPTPTPTATRAPVATPTSTIVVDVLPTAAPTAPAGCTPAAGAACP